ncbi:hypothetical protein FOL47_011350 [Perkinsus chesapeaki]|uniref:Uncharacterized protein n=1 Tax=Perkinsus chesapeaki TaxID=330153 RepID=A0A7J6KYD1_PERCH|nr:hypothetical protein FOL47_011350 [Perkinsus chesapeaki]
MNPNSTLAVDEVLGTLRTAYEKGGFNPSLVIHLLIVHGAELYAPYSSQGLRLLTEELAERIHSQVNVVIRRSQVKDDLLKQISLWNWQHSADENCQEGGEEAETPPAKRQRKPSRMSPQVSGWLPESDLSGILSAVNSKSTHSEYQDTGESEED